MVCGDQGLHKYVISIMTSFQRSLEINSGPHIICDKAIWPGYNTSTIIN